MLLDQNHYCMGGGPAVKGWKRTTRLNTRVYQVGENYIDIERPLTHNLSLIYRPKIYGYSSAVSDVGIEHLQIRFPLTQYPGHFRERGYNGVGMMYVSNSWVRNVAVVNADYGVLVSGTSFCTVSGIHLWDTGARATAPNSNGRAGHSGICVKQGTDNLIEHFNISKLFVHDVTAERFSYGTVFKHGMGLDVCMDHHR